MIGIIGAGLTGLSAAYFLNKDYMLFEKESKAGGHARTFNQNGFLYDFGGHWLHLRKDWVKQLLISDFGINLKSHQRDARIFLKNVYGKYPFQNNLRDYPEDIVIECLEGLAKASYCSKVTNIETFEDFIMNTMGEGIAKHFMIPYNTKLWSVPPSEMTTKWLGRFVPEPQFHTAIKNLISPNSLIQGYNSEFYYPESGGIGSLCDVFSQKVNNLQYNSELEIIDPDNKVIEFSNGNHFKYTELISTIPLIELVLRSTKIPGYVKEASEKLNWTNITIYNVAIRGFKLDYNWIYVPEDNFPFFRLGNYSKVVPNKENPEIKNLYIEFSWGKSFKSIPDTRELLNLLKNMNAVEPDAEIVDSLILNVKYAYVLYDKYREDSVRIIKNFFQSKDIHSTGRYGNWEYNSMEDAIIEGKETAEFLNS